MENNNLTADRIKIISPASDENPFCIIYKPHNIPSAPLSFDDKGNALYQAAELFPEIKNVSGKKEIEYGLIHRLDTATDGLLLIATTQESYDYFIAQQAEGKFIKYYKAKCDYIKDNADLLKGFPKLTAFNFESNETVIKSCFRPFGPGHKEVRPVIESSSSIALKKGGAKKYSTKISVIKKDDLYIADCSITSGYRHQVRCHLAWAGYPVKNDVLYNSKTKESGLSTDVLQFTAYAFEFIHPVTHKKEKVVIA